MLTREFLEGRRVRYISPLRLYLMASLVYFLSAAPRRSHVVGNAELRQRAELGFVGTTATAPQRAHASTERGEPLVQQHSAIDRSRSEIDAVTTAQTDSAEDDRARAGVHAAVLRRAIADPKGFQRGIVQAMPPDAVRAPAGVRRDRRAVLSRARSIRSISTSRSTCTRSSSSRLTPRSTLRRNSRASCRSLSRSSERVALPDGSPVYVDARLPRGVRRQLSRERSRKRVGNRVCSTSSRRRCAALLLRRDSESRDRGAPARARRPSPRAAPGTASAP